MRPIIALALLVPGPVLAHIPDDLSPVGSLGHQLTSLHHLPGVLMILAGWAILLVLALRSRRQHS